MSTSTPFRPTRACPSLPSLEDAPATPAVDLIHLIDGYRVRITWLDGRESLIGDYPTARIARQSAAEWIAKYGPKPPTAGAGAVASAYEPCPRAGCAIPVAPHDDHYHCANCTSTKITSSYGHYPQPCPLADRLPALEDAAEARRRSRIAAFKAEARENLQSALAALDRSDDMAPSDAETDAETAHRAISRWAELERDGANVSRR